MELVITSKGKEYTCFYNPADAEIIQQYDWRLNAGGYVVTYSRGKTFFLHRLLMGLYDSQNTQAICDHINHNPRDNRRENLRICTKSENRRNSLKSQGLTSMYKGVYLDRGYWHSQITIGKITRNLGLYKCEATAAKAYDQIAYSLFGSFACINFAEGLPVQTCIQFNYE
jgi:hypothetical protein